MLIFNGCNSQKDIKMKIPQITDSVEKFEIPNLSINSLDKEAREISSNKIHITKEENRYEVRDSNDEVLILYSKGLEKESFFSGYDYSLNPIIGLYKEFYPNNSIKVKGVYCWFGFKIGKWYSYSEDGDLISTDDFDDGFNYSVDQIFQFCKNNDIPLEKKMDGFRTEISKYISQDQKYYWYIQYPDNEKECYINIQIDGFDGKVIAKKEIQFPSDHREDNNRIDK